MSTEQRAFCDALAAQPITIEPRVTTVDWGGNSGQGKRSGGCVRGAVADPPRGVRTYTNRLGNLPDYEAVKVEVNELDGSLADRYLRARSFGLRHDAAMCYVYEIEAENAGLAWRWVRNPGLPLKML